MREGKRERGNGQATLERAATQRHPVWIRSTSHEDTAAKGSQIHWTCLDQDQGFNSSVAVLLCVSVLLCVWVCTVYIWRVEEVGWVHFSGNILILIHFFNHIWFLLKANMDPVNPHDHPGNGSDHLLTCHYNECITAATLLSSKLCLRLVVSCSQTRWGRRSGPEHRKPSITPTGAEVLHVYILSIVWFCPGTWPCGPRSRLWPCWPRYWDWPWSSWLRSWLCLCHCEKLLRPLSFNNQSKWKSKVQFTLK